MTNRRFTNFAGLAKTTGIPVRTLRTLYRLRKISGFKAGHRTLFFDPDKVCAELAKFEIKAAA